MHASRRAFETERRARMHVCEANFAGLMRTRYIFIWHASGPSCTVQPFERVCVLSRCLVVGWDAKSCFDSNAPDDLGVPLPHVRPVGDAEQPLGGQADQREDDGDPEERLVGLVAVGVVVVVVPFRVVAAVEDDGYATQLGATRCRSRPDLAVEKGVLLEGEVSICRKERSSFINVPE